MVMASWDHGSRECLRLVCVSSSFFFSSSSIFFRISSLPPGAFGSFLPPFSFAAAAAAAFSFSWAARTSGSTINKTHRHSNCPYVNTNKLTEPVVSKVTHRRLPRGERLHAPFVPHHAPVRTIN